MFHRDHHGLMRWSSRRGTVAVAFSIAIAVSLGGCAATQEPSASWQTNVDAEPQFPESKWGVKASPRVASQETSTSGGYKIGKPYQVGDKWYHPREQPDYDRIGIASWYGENFHGRKTANGEVYDMRRLTAAHPTLPMPSYVYVTNLSNNRTVLVRINDRGPYVKERIIDLSKASADALQLSGTAKVRVRYAGPAPIDGDDRRERHFLATGQDLGAAPSYAALVSGQPQLASAAALPRVKEPVQQPGGGQLTWRASPTGQGGPQMPPPAEGEPMWMPGQMAPPATTSALQFGEQGGAAAQGGYAGWDAASYRAGLSAGR